MGDLPNYDMGSFRIHTLPNFWIHLSADHAVSTVLIPTSPTTTKAVVTWLVDENAEEGKDYHLDQMLPLWHQTSIQDYDLCETNQKGVQSSRYQQGPLSPEKERAVERFYLWYLRSIGRYMCMGACVWG